MEAQPTTQSIKKKETRKIKKKAKVTTKKIVKKKPISKEEKKGKQAKGRVSNPTEFGQALYYYISRRGLSANQFAKEIKMSSGFLSGVYSGLKKPTLKLIDSWAKALNLNATEKALFLFLAEMEHTPKNLKNLILNKRSSIDKLCQMRKEVDFSKRA